MNDAFHRKIDYLRISVTDRCNLRCLYCLPPEGVRHLSHGDILRYEEIAEIVDTAADLGIRKIRLTGGEPLVRPGLAELIRLLASIKSIESISLTTNGIMLPAQAEKLAAAGLHRVNISLDSIKPENYQRITRTGELGKALEGVDAAISAGLNPVKINTVVIRGFNDDEVVNMAEWALKRGLHIRFIEFMPLNNSAFPFQDGFFSSEEIKKQLFSAFPGLVRMEQEGAGPAECWGLSGAEGSLGTISAVTHSFCGRCNRLRLTSDGKIKPCLFSDDEIDLMEALRDSGLSGRERIAGLKNLLGEAVSRKPGSHENFCAISGSGRFMSEIGG